MGCNKIGANADETWPVDQLRTLYNTYSGNFPDPNTPVDELVSFVREGAKQSVAEVAHRFGLTSSITMDAPLHLLSSQQHIMVSIVRALLTECDGQSSNTAHMHSLTHHILPFLLCSVLIGIEVVCRHRAYGSLKSPRVC